MYSKLYQLLVNKISLHNKILEKDYANGLKVARGNALHNIIRVFMPNT